jgi:hypothetical protein
VLSEADFDLEGAPPEGVPLAMIFSDMGQDQDRQVTVDGQSVEDVTGDFRVDEPEGSGMATIVVLAPADEQPRTAKIEMSTHRGTLAATVHLPGSGSSSPPESSDTTSSGDTGDTAESSPTESSDTDSPDPASDAEPTP